MTYCKDVRHDRWVKLLRQAVRLRLSLLSRVQQQSSRSLSASRLAPLGSDPTSEPRPPGPPVTRRPNLCHTRQASLARHCPGVPRGRGRTDDPFPALCDRPGAGRCACRRAVRGPATPSVHRRGPGRAHARDRAGARPAQHPAGPRRPAPHRRRPRRSAAGRRIGPAPGRADHGGLQRRHGRAPHVGPRDPHHRTRRRRRPAGRHSAGVGAHPDAGRSAPGAVRRSRPAGAASGRRPGLGRRGRRRRRGTGPRRTAGRRPRGRAGVVPGAVQLRPAGRIHAVVDGGARQPPRHGLGAVPAGRRPRLRAHLRSARVVELRRSVRLCVVSAGGGGLAPVLPRAMAPLGPLRLDLRRLRPLGMGDASLRPLGPQRGWRLVLDSQVGLEPGVGALGRGTGLRRLVPARVEQPAGARILGAWPGGLRWLVPRLPRRPVPCVVGRARPLLPAERARASSAVRPVALPERARAGLRRPADAAQRRRCARSGRRSGLSRRRAVGGAPRGAIAPRDAACGLRIEPRRAARRHAGERSPFPGGPPAIGRCHPGATRGHLSPRRRAPVAARVRRHGVRSSRRGRPAGTAC